MTDLVHYGVKGMKWGVHKSQPDNAGYSSSQRAADRRKLGRGAVKRINKRMNEGAPLAKARKQEHKRRARRDLAIAGAALGIRYNEQIRTAAKVAGTLAQMGLGVAVQSIAKRAETNRGRAAMAEARGLPRQASSGPSYSKQKRNGVYNITNL